MPQPIIAAHQVTQTIQINQNQFTILKDVDLEIFEGEQSKVAKIPSKVDLPEPERPVIATCSPSKISKSTSYFKRC
jgi:hypothetical protein